MTTSNDTLYLTRLDDAFLEHLGSDVCDEPARAALVDGDGHLVEVVDWDRPIDYDLAPATVAEAAE